MENKKKYHGGLKLSLLLLFTILLGLSSTSYAYFSEDYLVYGLDTLGTYMTTQTSNYQGTMRNICNTLKGHTQSITQILTYLNNYLDTINMPNLDDHNLICFAYDNDANYIIFKFFICNNSSPFSYNNLDFYLVNNSRLYTYSRNTTEKLYQMNINIRLNNGVPEFQNPSYTTLSNTSYASIFLGTSTIVDDLLYSTNVFCSGVPAGFRFNPITGTSSIVPTILMDLNGNYQFPSPDIPSGDSGDIGLGNITNSSGDNTGNINLNPIQNTLNNIENKIPSSGDIQGIISGETGRIIDNQNQNTQSIINNTNENIDNMFDTSNPDYNFDDFINEASGDFKNPYDINSINESFLNSFDDSMKEDFVISWNNYSFSVLSGDEVPLIPSGEINFSALCRNNESLGTIKNFISIFCISSLGITMLVEFYNLLLATFGIGSYFYANRDDDDMITNVYVDMNTGDKINSYHGTTLNGQKYSVSYKHKKFFRGRW